MKTPDNILASEPILPPASAVDEGERIRVLGEYDLDALEDDAELKALTDFAAELCGTETALVSLVEIERQRFLARTGLEACETPRSMSFCAHAMMMGRIMEVPDASEDPRFADNPLVLGDPQIRFYAGQPLVSEEGAPLGALCVIDSEVRASGLTEFQRRGLEVLGQAVMRRLEARRKAISARRDLDKSEERFKALADSLPDIAWSADEHGNIDYLNRRWQEFTGRDGATPLDGDLSHIHPEDREGVRKSWHTAIASSAPFEAEHRLQSAEGKWRWVIVRAEPVRDERGEAVRWYGTVTDIDDAHKLSESRDLLARELSHRIKNIFAVVSGLISLLSRRRPEYRDFGTELTATIHALGRAHDYVRPGGARQGSLHGILGDLFSPYANGDQPRVEVGGDDVPIAARAATPLALVFHELATNSAKYGALSTDDKRVTLSIEDRGADLMLRWAEHGCPPPPDAEIPEDGFGSRLVEMSVRGQLGGSWNREFGPDGLIVELVVSKGAISP